MLWAVWVLPRRFPLFNFFFMLVSLGSLVQSRCGEGGCCKQIALLCAHSVSAPLDLSLLAAYKLLQLYDAQLGTV